MRGPAGAHRKFGRNHRASAPVRGATARGRSGESGKPGDRETVSVVARNTDGAETVARRDVVAETNDGADTTGGTVLHAAEVADASMSASVVHGAKWMAVSQVATQVTRFATNIVLARLLLPSDFGLIAVATVVMLFLEQIRDLGTGTTVIQRKDVTEKLLNTVFYLNTAIGILLALAVFLLAPSLAVALGNPGSTHILQAFGGITLLTSFGHIQHALLRRTMKFRQVGVISTVSAFVTAGVSIGLAAAGMGVWSIVIGMFAANTIGVVMAWVYSGWRPGLSVSASDLSSVWSFAGYLLLTNIVVYLLQQSDKVIVNRALGVTALGVYALAQRVLLYPMQSVTVVLTEVLFPAFSRKQDDNEALRRAYVRSNNVIALITFPLMAGAASVAPIMVHVLLGDKWRDLVPLMIILAPAGAIQAISSNASSLMLAKGHSRANFGWSVVIGIVILTGFGVGVRWNLVGMCITYAVLLLLLTPAMWHVAFRYIDLRIRDFLRVLLPVALLTLVMSGAVVAAGLLLRGTMPDVVTFLVQIIVGAAVYIGLLLRFKPPAYIDALRSLRRRSA
ncbi:MAG: hypothetical protein JWM93_2638 [Frankiales bacterium]|nr:hypothetical protein [Frankiales bacterium]